jgi:hypothetical protein
LIISSIKYLIAGIIIFTASSCGIRPPGKGTSPRGKELPAPYALKAQTGSHRAVLYWSIKRSKDDIISGYNIYIVDATTGKEEPAWSDNPGPPYNQTPYPGDVDGDINHESIPLEHLQNGRTYLALVRTVGPGRRESKSSNIVSFTPLACGEFIISANQDASDGGFNFESERQVPGRDPKSDIYLYATKERIGLSAPYRLGGGFRKTRFIGGSTMTPLETISIRKGQSLEVLTKAGRADIKIEDILGQYPDIAARIGYVFYPAETQ